MYILNIYILYIYILIFNLIYLYKRFKRDFRTLNYLSIYFSLLGYISILALILICLLALFGEGDNAMNLILRHSKEFVNFLIHKFPLSLGSSGSC